MRYDYLKKPTGAVDERVRWWHEEIERGVARRKKEEKAWDHNEKYENLEQWGDIDATGEIKQRAGSGDEVTINKVASYVKTHLSAVVPRNPRPRVRPKTADGYEPVMVPVLDGNGTPREGADGGIEVKEVVLHQAREDMIDDIITSPGFGLRKTIERVVKAGDLGYGCVKATYSPHFRTPRNGDSKGTIKIDPKDGSLDLSPFERSKVDGKLVTTEDGKSLIEKDDIPIWEDYRWDYVHYRRMIIDPECENDSRGLRWLVEEEMAVLEDVKKDPLYKNTEDLQAGTYGEDKYDAHDIMTATEWSDSTYQDDKSKRILLFHIWDLVEKRYMVLADGHGEFLRDGPPPDGIRRHPYAFYRPTEVLGEWYPRPRVTDLAPINDAFNLFYQKWMQAAGHATVKVLTWEDSLSPEGMEALTNEVNYEVVQVKRAGQPGSLNERVAAFATPPVSAEVYAHALKQLDKEFYEVGGIPPEALGVPKSDTATQAQMMGAYNTSRMDMDRECLAGMFRVLLKKTNDLIDATMTRERAVRLRGTDGQVFVGVVDPGLIYCDCDMDVDVEDMAPDNTQMQMANRLQLMQIAGQAPWQFQAEALVRGWADPLGIKDPNFIRELAQAAQMQVEILKMQAMPPPPNPEAGAPTSEADAISQAGAGMQTRRMQGAT